jgi:hypothetical protein
MKENNTGKKNESKKEKCTKGKQCMKIERNK